MRFTQKISPVWAITACVGFISSIALVVAHKTSFQHEGVALAPRPANTNTSVHLNLPTPPTAENAVVLPADFITSRKEDGTLVTHEFWRAVGDPAIDTKCGAMEDYDIGYVRLASTSLIEMGPAKLFTPEGIKDWMKAQESIRHLKTQFGDKIEQCFHPMLFDKSIDGAYNRQVYENVNKDWATTINTATSIEDRYAAWDRVRKMVYEQTGYHSEKGYIPSDAILNHLGQDKDAFFEMGRKLSRPLIAQAKTDAEMTIKVNEAELNLDQISWAIRRIDDAKTMVVYTNQRDQRLDDYRYILQGMRQSRPYVGPTLKDLTPE